jgi:hypothetical protein
MAKFHAALKPGGVWAFNTYDRRSLWGRLFGPRWYILVANTSQIHDGATLRRLIDEAGFDLVARRRDRPHASVERLLFVLLSHVSHGVRDGFFRRVHFLNRLVIPVRRPTPTSTSASSADPAVLEVAADQAGAGNASAGSRPVARILLSGVDEHHARLELRRSAVSSWP